MENPREFRLFVDDNREIPKGWHGARTVSDTIQYLHKFSPIAELSLDFDILFPQHGIDRYAMYSAENYSGVFYYLLALPKEKWPKKLIVHSTNSGAALSMVSLLGLTFEEVYKPYDKNNYQ